MVRDQQHPLTAAHHRSLRQRWLQLTPQRRVGAVRRLFKLPPIGAVTRAS